MEIKIEDQKSRDPEADTYFLGRSIIDDPEFNEQTILHENIAPSTFEASPVNENVTSKSPNRIGGATSEPLSIPVSNGFSAPNRDVAVANNAHSTENLYEAVVVTDRPRKTNVVTIALAAFGTSAIIAAMVVLGVCFSGDCGSKDSDKRPIVMTIAPTYRLTFYPTVSPTDPPIDVMVEQAVYGFVSNITYSDRKELTVNGTNPESRALTWLIQNDTLFQANTYSLLTLNSHGNDSLVSRRVRQRYALATLWFQEVDEVRNWTNTSGWLQVYDECEWYGIYCDENMSVTQILFYDNLSGTETANGFVGTIPPDIGLLTSLQNFSMRLNNVFGTIPESIGNCIQMFAFLIQDCSVSGKIPPSLGQWTGMYFFEVSSNALTGIIPDSLASWTKVVFFSALENMLSGSIPSFVAQWSRLEFFGVSSNQLTRTIPEDIGYLTDLSLFAVTKNRLTGTLPSSIGRLTALKYFLVNENSLTGTIPSSVGNWSQLEYAYFDSNEFTGTVPQEICDNIQENETVTIFRDCDVNCSCCTTCV